MASLPWIGLSVFLVAIAGGMALAAIRGLAAWRAFRSFERRLDRAVADTTRLVDGIEPRVERASEAAVPNSRRPAPAAGVDRDRGGALRRRSARRARSSGASALSSRAESPPWLGSQQSTSGRTRPGCLVAGSRDLVRRVVRRTTVTRLGEGVDATRRLLPAATYARSRRGPARAACLAPVRRASPGAGPRAGSRAGDRRRRRDRGQRAATLRLDTLACSVRDLLDGIALEAGGRGTPRDLLAIANFLC